MQAQVGAALIEIMQIKYLGFAVGSKVVAFRNPQSRPSNDSIISAYISNRPSEEMRQLGGVSKSNKHAQANLYENWWVFREGQGDE
jgi:hypothetical protein